MTTQNIRKSILQYIEEKKLQPGDKMPTYRQMAEMFGCSLPTVQHAITQLVSEKVLVARVGAGTFVAEAQGRTSSRLIGILLPATYGRSNNFIYDLQSGIHDSLVENGFIPVTLNPKPGVYGDERSVSEQQILEQFLQQGVAAVIVSSLSTAEAPVWHYLADYPVPVVMVNSLSPVCRRWDGVLSDNVQGGRIGGEYLISQGCRRLCFCSDLDGTRTEYERWQGLAEACREAGLQEPPNFGICNFISSEDMDKFDGILCINDTAAYQLQQVVPEGTMLIGFDGYVPAFEKRPLPSIAQQSRRMGIVAVELLRRRLAAPAKLDEQVIITLGVSIKYPSA